MWEKHSKKMMIATTNPTESSGEDDLTDVEQRRKLLQEVTQETRHTLLQNILMHPQRMPSLEEISYVNPDKSRATLREHLHKLINLGVVQTVELPAEKRSRDLPHKFYTFTEKGLSVVDELGLLDIEDTLKYLYQNMEKTDKVERYESATRPEIAEELQK